jgi:uncharacterized protein YbaR (Trm112 family)
MQEKPEMRCPECRASLKQRRTRNPDACEMLCGGCGRIFDVCDEITLKEVREKDERTDPP